MFTNKKRRGIHRIPSLTLGFATDEIVTVATEAIASISNPS